MKAETQWHLRKELSISLIITIGLLFVSSVYAWARLENTVENNSAGILRNERTLVETVNKIDSVYEGLLAAGIIQPIAK